MGFVGQMLGGLAGGMSDAAGIRDISMPSPVTPGQVEQTYGQSQTGLAQQQAFLQALQAQNGLGNQANVFGQQQQLANQLQQQSMGMGPNPALAQLNQATGQNISQQAALMAGQRGAGANAGLIARQAAMQGGSLQQQSAGQGATMQAQQQLAAQQALMQQQQSMQQVAGQQVQNQAGAIGGYNNAAQNLYGTGVGGLGNYNATNANAQAGVNQQRGAIGKEVIGGAMSGAGAAIGAMHDGGMAGYAQGGSVGPQSNVGRHLSGLTMQHGGPVPGHAQVAGDSLKNDTIKALLSPEEIVIPRSITMGENAPQKAAEFVAQILSQQGKKKDDQNFARGGVAKKDDESVDANPMPSALPSAQPYVAPPAQPVIDQAAMPAQTPVPQMAMPAPMPVEEPQVLAPAPAAQQPAQPQDPYGFGAQASMTEKAISEGRQGILAEQQATSALGNQQAKIEFDAAKANQQLQTDFQTNYNTLMKERQGFMQDLQNKHVDPKRYLNNQGVGSKISTAIGLILGGIGGGLTHQENPALAFLNKQIDNDIESQKADLGKTNNLLSANLQQFGNMKDAMTMTKIMQNDIVSNQLKEAIAKAQDPMAKAKAMQALATWDKNSADLSQGLAMKKSLMGGASAGNLAPEQAIGLLVPKEDHKAAREELSLVNGYTSAVKGISQDFAEMKGIGGIGGNTPFSDDKAKSAAIGAKIISRIRASMKGQGALSDQEIEDTIKPLVPKATDTVGQIDEKQKGLMDILFNKISGGTPILNQYRISPIQGSMGGSGGGNKTIDFKPNKKK